MFPIPSAQPRCTCNTELKTNIQSQQLKTIIISRNKD